MRSWGTGAPAGSRLAWAHKTLGQKETRDARTSPLPDPPPTPPFSTLQTRSSPLPLIPAHAPPPPLRSHCPAATVASPSPVPPPLPHLAPAPAFSSPPSPLSVDPDGPAGGVWERGTCEQVSSLDEERTVPSKTGVHGVGAATGNRGEGRGEIPREEEGVTGMRVWLAEEGSGTELAAQNHSCLDRFASGLGLPYIPPLELWLGPEAGISLSVLIVKSGVPLTLQCHMERESPHTLGMCHLQGAGLLPPLGKSQNHPTSSLPLPPT